MATFRYESDGEPRETSDVARLMLDLSVGDVGMYGDGDSSVTVEWEDNAGDERVVTITGEAPSIIQLIYRANFHRG